MNRVPHVVMWIYEHGLVVSYERITRYVVNELLWVQASTNTTRLRHYLADSVRQSQNALCICEYANGTLMPETIGWYSERISCITLVARVLLTRSALKQLLKETHLSAIETHAKGR